MHHLNIVPQCHYWSFWFEFPNIQNKNFATFPLGQKKILFDCPHRTDPDFENLKKGFFFFFLFYFTKEYWPCFKKFLKKFCFVLFWHFCILKREEDCVLEVCIKHATCFKYTICILHQHIRCVWCLEHLLRDKCIHALGVYCHL